jgi:hypothetical protein
MKALAVIAGIPLIRCQPPRPYSRFGTGVRRAVSHGHGIEPRLSYRQVQMLSKHRDPKTVMRYDHGRENLDQSAVNFLGYDEE